jgi:hypothetical protein
MKKKYVVLLRSRDGYPYLMTTGATTMAEMFDSEDDARIVAEENPLGIAYGFKIVSWSVSS